MPEAPRKLLNHWKEAAIAFLFAATVGEQILNFKWIEPETPPESPCGESIDIGEFETQEELFYKMAKASLPLLMVSDDVTLTEDNFAILYGVTPLVEGNSCEGVKYAGEYYDGYHYVINYQFFYREDPGPKNVGLVIGQKAGIFLTEEMTDGLVYLFPDPLRSRLGDAENFAEMVKCDPFTGKCQFVKGLSKQHNNGWVDKNAKDITCPLEESPGRPLLFVSNKNAMYYSPFGCKTNNVIKSKELFGENPTGVPFFDKQIVALFTKGIAATGDDCTFTEIIDPVQFLMPANNIYGDGAFESHLLKELNYTIGDPGFGDTLKPEAEGCIHG